MIIRSKDKINVNGKNNPVWILDTDALTVTQNTPDAKPNVTIFNSDHIKEKLLINSISGTRNTRAILALSPRQVQVRRS